MSGAGTKSIGLIKRGFHEIPHIMIGGCASVLWVVMAVVISRRHNKYDRSKRMFKRRYTVVREEDFDPKRQVHPIHQKYPAF